jgi:hypothetical protein
MLAAAEQGSATERRRLVPYLVRAFPLIRPVSELHTFLSALSGARRAETDTFYGHYGVSHESAYVQETPHGNLLIVVTVLGDHQETAQRYKAASEEFHGWFKAQILYLTGVDPNATPLGPPSIEVFSWP